MHVMYVEKVVTKCAEILLRNARCHKMRRNFVTKCALSQNAQKFCYEMSVVTKFTEVLLRNARVVTLCAVVTKCALTHPNHL